MCVPTICSTCVIEIHDFKDPYTWKTAKGNQSKFEMYVHYSQSRITPPPLSVWEKLDKNNNENLYSERDQDAPI